MGKKKKRKNKKKHSPVVIERYNRIKNASLKNVDKAKNKNGDWISTLIVILIIAIMTLPELIQNVRQQSIRDKHL